MRFCKKIIYITIESAAVLLIITAIYDYTHTFSPQKWIEHPMLRDKMIDDFLRGNSLMGTSKEDVLVLLGDDDYIFPEPMTFKISKQNFYRCDTLVYKTGDGLLETCWLIITVDTDNVVSDYFIDYK